MYRSRTTDSLHFECLLDLRFTFQQADCNKIPLTEADHDDLSTIIHKVLPHAPHFKTLLESQLQNCKSKDARHRRWDVNMISLCLNLWAKYVFPYNLPITKIYVDDHVQLFHFF